MHKILEIESNIPFLTGDLELGLPSKAWVFLLLFAPLRFKWRICGRVDVVEDLKMESWLWLFPTVFPILTPPWSFLLSVGCSGERLTRHGAADGGTLSVFLLNSLMMWRCSYCATLLELSVSILPLLGSPFLLLPAFQSPHNFLLKQKYFIFSASNDLTFSCCV